MVALTCPSYTLALRVLRGSLGAMPGTRTPSGVGPPARALTPNELRARSSGMFSHLVTRVGDAIQGPVPRGRAVGMRRRPWSVLPAEFTRWTSWLVTRVAGPDAHAVAGAGGHLGQALSSTRLHSAPGHGLWSTGSRPRRRDHGRTAVAEACRHGSSGHMISARGGCSGKMAQFWRERSIETAW